MSKATLRILLLFLTTMLCGLAMAQAPSPEVQSQVELFLQSHPEVVDQLKQLLAQQLQQEGSAIDPQAITEAMLAAREPVG